MNDEDTKGERRERKRQKRRKMRVVGTSVRTLQNIIKKRADRLRKKSAKTASEEN